MIQQAQLNGLRALVNLLRVGATQGTKHLAKKAADRLNTAIDTWLQSKADGHSDFSHVTKEEKHLRNIELATYWISAKKHGSNENKRIRSERQGVVGPLNRMLNIVGAQARDYHLFMHPMQDGEMIAEDGVKKGWGYYGAGPTENVLLGHGPVLAEFDLVDMTRSHNRRLAERAFVLRGESYVISRYALLLNRRLTPFIDYVYTHGVHGSKTFRRPRHQKREERENLCADEILQEILGELRALYGTEVALPPKPSGDSVPASKQRIKDFFPSQIDRLKREARQTSFEEAEHLLAGAGLLEKMTDKKKLRLRQRDVRRLHDEFTQRARYAGIVHHRLVLDGLPSPRSLESVVLQGDRFLKRDEGFLVVAELRIDTPGGTGRADLVVFKRERLQLSPRPDLETVLKPIAVLDIKTKSAFNWEIKPQESKKEQKRQKVFPRFEVRRRVLTQDEWEQAISQVLQKKADRTQLKHYKDGLLARYHDLTGDKGHNDLVTGIILLDAGEDVTTHREAVVELIQSLRNSATYSQFTLGAERVVVRAKDRGLNHAALVICRPRGRQAELLRTPGEPLKQPVIFNPFSESLDSKHHHILYLSARDASKSGRTASWISRYYHGLQYLESIMEDRRPSDVLWMDLAGIFGVKSLAEIRLRLVYQEKSIREMFRGITVRDISSVVDRFLFQGGPLPDIRALTTTGKEEPSLIVVSGWDMVRDSCPPRLERALRELEGSLVVQMNETARTVLWLDEAERDEFTSATYHCSTLVPFDNDSPHRHFVKEIVYNVPVRPYAVHHYSSMLDDLRVNIRLTPGEVSHQLLEIPPLEEWSSKLNGEFTKRRRKQRRVWRGRRLTPKDAVQDRALAIDLINTAYELLPWVERLYPDNAQPTVPKSKAAKASLQVIPLFGKPSKGPGVLSRVSYRARRKDDKDEKWDPSEAARKLEKKIKSQRHYRREKPPKVEEVRHSSRSPDEVLMKHRDFDEYMAAELEMKRLRQVIRVLRKQGRSKSDAEFMALLDYLKKLVSVKRAGRNIARQVSETLAEREVSKGLWERLLWMRERMLARGLRLEQRKSLDKLLETRPDLSTTYGNYLFLLLLAVVREEEIGEKTLQLLWETVKAWQLEHLGFYVPEKVSETVSKSKFQVRAIFHNLCRRFSGLSRMPAPAQTSVRFGQLWTVTGDAELGHWLLLEGKYRGDELISGLFLGRHPLSLMSTMRWSEMDHSVITEYADVSEPESVQDLVVAEVRGIDYMWTRTEEGEWLLLGQFQMIPRRRNALTRVWGVKLDPVGDGSIDDVPRFVHQPEILQGRARQELRRLAAMQSRVVEVECGLSVQSGQYLVEFESDRKAVDTFKTTSTAELLELLRRPLVDGLPVPHSSIPNRFMTWNPYENISYSQLQLLRPYVERKWPYVHVEVPLPRTAQELARRPVREIKVIIHHDASLCPLADGSADAHGDCWRVSLDDDCRDPDLVALCSTPLSETDIVSLLSAGEIIFERGRYRLSIQCEHNPQSREGVAFRESWRIAKALGLPSVRPGSYLFMDSEELLWEFSARNDHVFIFLYSSITGKKVNRVLVQCKPDEMDIAAATAFAEESLKGAVQEYYDENTEPEDCVQDLDSLMERLHEWLFNVKVRGMRDRADDMEGLEMQLEFFREAAKRDEAREYDLVDILVRLARLEMEEGSHATAADSVDEAIEILERYVARWQEDAARELLDEARHLRERISET